MLSGVVTKERRKAQYNVSLDAKLKSCEKEAQNLRTELANSKDVEFSLRKELEIWQMAQHITTDDLNVAELKLKVVHYENENAELKAEVERTRRALESCVNDVAKFSDDNEELGGANKELNERLYALSIEHTTVTSQLEVMQNSWKTRADQLEAVTADNAALRTQVQDLQSEVTVLMDSQSEANANTELQAKEATRLRQALAEERTQAEEVVQELEQTKKEFKDLREEYTYIMQELSRHAGLLHPLQEEVESLRERCALLEGEAGSVSKLHETTANAVLERDNAVSDLHAIRREFDAICEQERVSSRKAEEALKALATERGRIATMSSEHRESRRVNEESEAQMQRRLEQTSNQVDGLQDQLADTRQKLTTAESEVARLRILVAHRAKAVATARKTTLSETATSSSRVSRSSTTKVSTSNGEGGDSPGGPPTSATAGDITLSPKTPTPNRPRVR